MSKPPTVVTFSQTNKHAVPPAERKKTARNIWIGFGVVAALALGVVAAGGGGTGQQPPVTSQPLPNVVTTPSSPPTVLPTGPIVTAAPKPTKPVTTKPIPPKPRTGPAPVRLGDAFTTPDGDRVLAGWKIRSSYGYPTLTGKVKNTRQTDSFVSMVDFRFTKGSELVMDVTCTVGRLEPEQTGTMKCWSADQYGRFDRITVQ